MIAFFAGQVKFAFYKLIAIIENFATVTKLNNIKIKEKEAIGLC